jgi:predicted site-specific integrase-resolvase
MAHKRDHSPIVVFRFDEWCRMRGISIATGRRLVSEGKVKITRLSERRIGIRSDHDREFLDRCLEER